MSTEPSKPPSHRADQDGATSETVESEAAKALDRLMFEARKLIVEMRRLLREQRQH